MPAEPYSIISMSELEICLAKTPAKEPLLYLCYQTIYYVLDRCNLYLTDCCLRRNMNSLATYLIATRAWQKHNDLDLLGHRRKRGHVAPHVINYRVQLLKTIRKTHLFNELARIQREEIAFVPVLDFTVPQLVHAEPVLLRLTAFLLPDHGVLNDAVVVGRNRYVLLRLEQQSVSIERQQMSLVPLYRLQSQRMFVNSTVSSESV